MAATPETKFEPFIPAHVVMKEFTARAVITGVILGTIFGASSLYLVLKVGITVSVGVAPGRSKPLDFDAMLNEADKALYVAKRGGRNRVELASHLHSVPAGVVRSAS